jgi:hypothetical protein
VVCSCIRIWILNNVMIKLKLKSEEELLPITAKYKIFDKEQFIERENPFDEDEDYNGWINLEVVAYIMDDCELQNLVEDRGEKHKIKMLNDKNNPDLCLHIMLRDGQSYVIQKNKYFVNKNKNKQK